MSPGYLDTSGKLAWWMEGFPRRRVTKFLGESPCTALQVPREAQGTRCAPPASCAGRGGRLKLWLLVVPVLTLVQVKAPPFIRWTCGRGALLVCTRQPKWALPDASHLVTWGYVGLAGAFARAPRTTVLGRSMGACGHLDARSGGVLSPPRGFRRVPASTPTRAPLGLWDFSAFADLLTGPSW